MRCETTEPTEERPRPVAFGIGTTRARGRPGKVEKEINRASRAVGSLDLHMLALRPHQRRRQGSPAKRVGVLLPPESSSSHHRGAGGAARIAALARLAMAGNGRSGDQHGRNLSGNAAIAAGVVSGCAGAKGCCRSGLQRRSSAVGGVGKRSVRLWWFGVGFGARRSWWGILIVERDQVWAVRPVPPRTSCPACAWSLHTTPRSSPLAD